MHPIEVNKGGWFAMVLPLTTTALTTIYLWHLRHFFPSAGGKGKRERIIEPSSTLRPNDLPNDRLKCLVSRMEVKSSHRADSPSLAHCRVGAVSVFRENYGVSLCQGTGVDTLHTTLLLCLMGNNDGSFIIFYLRCGCGVFPPRRNSRSLTLPTLPYRVS